ncbi:Hypothetical protein R9X50_00770900 [Acrodontium crateriforme]|uniref:Autophagy-related protein 2 n=1 Tax=Acrodontium crateriforme TaxID=150365 RepID=A0AAQ3MA41_9PEZI|nr:Hypothetical protein R9X50_00770900 [Acrodontium crateriforme]
MAWWQKKLLHYALARTGLLDEQAIDLANLDITLGRTNVVELKNVALNIKRITKLAQLPPNVRLETARVLSLRLTVPADIYKSSIVADIDGVEVVVRLDERSTRQGTQIPNDSKNPQHRKVHRRPQLSPGYDPGGYGSDDENGPRNLTTERLAMSFLQEEPVHERRELEASLAAERKGLDESVASESSGSDDLGTGASLGLPGFLAGFLQGIVDRFKIHIKNVEVKLETNMPGDDREPIPLTLRLHLAAAELEGLDTNELSSTRMNKRHINLQGLSVDLCTEDAVFSGLSGISSPAVSKTFAPESPSVSPKSDNLTRERNLSSSPTQSSQIQHDDMYDSNSKLELAVIDKFGADATVEEEHDSSPPPLHEDTDLDIQAGDDNISWGSRRSKSSAPAEDIWSSVTSDDDLPDSLLIDRAQTPLAQNPSHGILKAARLEHQSVFPFDRAIQSPGSWPQLDHSPERNEFHDNPESWPNLNRTRPPDEGTNFALEAPETVHSINNQFSALELVDDRVDIPATSPEPAREDLDAMSQSMMYSHEEAESMYMSAMTQSPHINVPGGWASDTAESSPSLSPEVNRTEGSHDYAVDLTGSARASLSGGIPQPQEGSSGNVTPRQGSPTLERYPTNDGRQNTIILSKRLIYINSITLQLPNATASDKEAESMPNFRSPKPDRFGSAEDFHGMPGTFSAYSDLAASRRRGTSSTHESTHNVVWSPLRESERSDPSKTIEVEICDVRVQVDIPCCRLLYKFALSTAESFQPNQSSTAETASAAQSANFSISVSVQQLQASWVENLTTDLKDSTAAPIFHLVAAELIFSNINEEINIQFGRLALNLGTSELLSFDRNGPTSSVILTETTPDISVRISSSQVTVHNRPVTEVTYEMLPLLFVMDLGAIDDVLVSFGGLSGIIELGSSMLSDNGRKGIETPRKPSKGVRFEEEAHPSIGGSILKINGRLGGAHLVLRGTASIVVLRTSSIKTIYREHGAGVTIERISIDAGADLLAAGSGLLKPEADGPLKLDLSSFRLEYLPSPQNSDLETLLSLLTPCKDKYETDDDILLDTLLRQRRKGALLRVSASGLRAKMAHFDCLGPLQAFGNELSKLSAVADYLPEDERPGILTIAKINLIEVAIPVNDRFGKLRINLRELQCAHVGLPALVALSVGTMQAFQSDAKDLIRPLVPSESAENIPMVMARMLGDDFEPTVKIKLFNVCIEYSVATLLDLINSDGDVDREQLFTELTQSVAQLTPLPRVDSDKSWSLKSEPVSRSTKKTAIELLLHHCAIGLKPEKSDAKGMVVLTDAIISTVVPPEKTFKIALELRKAAIFVVNVETDNGEQVEPKALNNSSASARIGLFLSKRGYTSIGSIMSARVSASISETTEDAKAVDVDFSNELFLMETCADSTQTLISIFSGLAPPPTPSKQPQFRTEPMTIEDMMASFTGEAFPKSERPSEMLFDVEEPLDDSSPDAGDTDSLLADSEMTSSLYGPVSGIFEGVDKSDDDEFDYDDTPETAESLLEEDPFEITASPTDKHMSDAALVRDLNRQCKPAVSNNPVDLGSWELDDLGFDALAPQHHALGDPNRFNPPCAVIRKPSPGKATTALPFRLRMRDVHFIWNIHDGYDWQNTRDTITKAVEQVENKAEERRRRSRNEPEEDESVIGDLLFNSVYIGIPATQGVSDLRHQINHNIDDLVSETESIPVSGMSRDTAAYSGSGRPIRQLPRRRLKLHRSKQHKVAFELKGISADILVFPPDSGEVVSSVDLRVRDIEVFDNVPTSTWKKFLTLQDNSPNGREMSKPMAHIELFNVRTLEEYAASEIVLHVSLLPLRLHVDQDALDFITRFFEFKDEKMINQQPKSDQPFLQRVEIDTVDLQLDYKPKHVDYAGIRSGHTTEFMNFVTLDAANIRLKHAIIYGIRGFEPLHKTLNDVWMPDIRRNQLPTILAGLAPVRSLVNLGTGVRDVVAIPVREYRKDGRVVRSIQKGAFHFGKTTASELARLGAKVAMGTQNILSGAEGLLSPLSARPSSHRISADHPGWTDLAQPNTAHADDEEGPHAISAYANQPLSLISGLRSARQYLEHDLLTARDALIAVAGETMEPGQTPGGAAMAIARHAPTVILRPVIGASRAVGTALLGVGNQIDRSGVRGWEDKYKRR